MPVTSCPIDPNCTLWRGGSGLCCEQAPQEPVSPERWPPEPLSKDERFPDGDEAPPIADPSTWAQEEAA